MQPTRRQVLLAGAVLAAPSLSACTTDHRPPRRGPTPEDGLRAEAVAREQALVAAYDSAMQQHPALSGRLAALRSDHAAHLAALGASPAPSASPSTSPSTSGSSAASPSAPASPSGPAAGVLASLVARERAAASAHAAAAVAAEAAVTCGRTLSPLLASLAASEASHAAVLG